MIVDSRTLDPNTAIEADVCIVGAGAAGIAAALELSRTEYKVCLVESGSDVQTDETRSLSLGDITGMPYYPLDEDRWRGLGGSTHLWAGWCRPLDGIDFEKRDWVDHSGWPIGLDELTPYYERSQPICGIGEYSYDSEYWRSKLGLPPFPLTSDTVLPRAYQISAPLRFGTAYRRQLESAANLTVLTNGNVTNIETDENRGAVTSVRVRCLSGPSFDIRATYFVLAAGGIENARLLLASDSNGGHGLGNENDLVGRFFMEHVHFPSGYIRLKTSLDRSALLYDPRSRPIVSRLFVSEEHQRTERLLNYNAMLEPVQLSSRSRDGRGVSRVRKSLLRRILGRLTGSTQGGYKTPFSIRRGAGLRLFHTLEQAPNPESRVTLLPETDAIGMRKVALNWQTSSIDISSFRRSREMIGEAFSSSGLGELELEPEREDLWPPPPLQGRIGHHMGTTRMSADPSEGVVDSDCRVHSVRNLFIAGSSVFPTSGSGTPTITIVALAIRLADHLRDKLSVNS